MRIYTNISYLVCRSRVRIRAALPPTLPIPTTRTKKTVTVTATTQHKKTIVKSTKISNKTIEAVELAVKYIF